MPTQSFDHTLLIPNGDHEVPACVEKHAAATHANPVPAVVILHAYLAAANEPGYKSVVTRPQPPR